jgi:hypothetical protein
MVTLMEKLVIISVTWNTPRNSMSDPIMHVTLMASCLDYTEEVHRSIKNVCSKQGYLRQILV